MAIVVKQVEYEIKSLPIEERWKKVEKNEVKNTPHTLSHTLRYNKENVYFFGRRVS